MNKFYLSETKLCIYNLVFTVLTLCLFSDNEIFAQSNVTDYVELNEELIRRQSGENEMRNIEGSPYLEQEFVSGKIIRGGNPDLSVYLRYDVFQDRLEFRIHPKDDETFVLPQTEGVSFQLEDYCYYLNTYTTEDGERLSGYFIRYYEGDRLVLIGKPSAKVLPARPAQTSYDQPKPATIRVASRFFLSTDSSPLVEIKLKKRHLRKIFGEGNLMKKYFRSHRLRNVSEVVDMLEYYENHR